MCKPKNLHPILVNNSSIPSPLQAEVSLNIAPISFAKCLASHSGTLSSSNKSLLFPAIPITNIIIIKYIFFLT